MLNKFHKEKSKKKERYHFCRINSCIKKNIKYVKFAVCVGMKLCQRKEKIHCIYLR